MIKELTKEDQDFLDETRKELHELERDYWLQLLIDVWGYKIRSLTESETKEINRKRSPDCACDLYVVTTHAGLDWNEVAPNLERPEEIIKLVEGFQNVYD